MIVFVPNNNTKEREYILHIILKEFLGLDYKLVISSHRDSEWVIVLNNKNRLVFEDHFFNKFQKDKEYLDIQNIPIKVNYYTGDKRYLAEKNLPIIYGDSMLKESVSEGVKEIYCGIDIFASSFFMLSRWEEYVHKERDNHNRFPSYASLAYKNGFLDRPVVNEYVFFLHALLKNLGLNKPVKKRVFKKLVTHDVDVPLMFPSWKSGFGEIVRDITQRKDIRLACLNMITKLKNWLRLERDPYDTFEFLMDLSDECKLKSYFFFMAEGTSSFDNRYSLSDPDIKRLIHRINDRGHIVGIHPTYNSYNDVNQFAKEKKELEQSSEIANFNIGRQHFLRFEVPTTWQIWEDNMMRWDSTLSYADREGFRCGVCYEFSVFNILTRRRLKLKERPLIVMEGSFTTYQKHIPKKEMINKIVFLQEKVKKYNGTFVFLWHNSSFNTPSWKKYKGVYEYIIRSK